ncbi:hypothetical protein [Donghicola eburneus]|uniref:hypothetical protein n=1 Tax=Donghicola eburneus TaxID=393278 RepID=UPI0008E5809C|nr:hypothetical protein [Donghicola eburneus]SFQ60809.1 hypothetical protein SAMN05421764_107120 [Donghicola eburneus]
MPKFEAIRLSLSVPTIGNLAKDRKDREPKLSRQEFLLEAFSRRIDFFYAGSLYHYVPGPKETQIVSIISGFIGKSVSETVASGPDELFAQTRTKRYKASFISVDIAPDKQIILFEKRSDVGNSRNILDQLFAQFIRERRSLSWHVDLEFMSRAVDFWKLAKKHEGNITEISFEFLPPNGLKAEMALDKLKQVDRVAKQTTNAEISEYSLKNKAGQLRPQGRFISDAIDYIEKGGGKATMKNGRHTIYSSHDERVIIPSPETLMPRQAEPTKIMGIADWLWKKLNG